MANGFNDDNDNQFGGCFDAVAGAQIYEYAYTSISPADQCWAFNSPDMGLTPLLVNNFIDNTTPAHFNDDADEQSNYADLMGFLDNIASDLPNEILLDEFIGCNAVPVHQVTEFTCTDAEPPADILAIDQNVWAFAQPAIEQNELLPVDRDSYLQNVYTCWIDTEGCNFSCKYKSQYRPKGKSPIVNLNVLHLSNFYCFFDICLKVEHDNMESYPKFYPSRLYNDDGPIESNICPMKLIGDRHYSCNLPSFYLAKEKREYPPVKVLCQKLMKYRALVKGLEQSQLSDDEMNMVKNTALINGTVPIVDKSLCLMVCICIMDHNGNYKSVSGPHFSN